MTDSSSLLTVIVYIPGRFAVRLPISPVAQLSELRSHINLWRSSFVRNGQLLLDQITFSFYWIREMDVIFAVSGSNADAQKWTKVAEESATFQERIHFILKPETARELAACEI
jgi:hypothetical protein